MAIGSDPGTLAEQVASAIDLPLSRRISITECCRWEDLERFRGDWDELLSANPNLGIFCTPEWLGPWWRAYGKGRSLLTLVFADESGQTAGIAPFYFERSASVGWLKANFLRLVGDGSEDSDDLDFIVRPGYERAIAASFLDWAEKKPWHVCELNCISPRSIVAAHLLEELSCRRWRHVRRDRVFVTVQLPESWELFLKRLSGKERGKVGNLFRRLESRYQLQFRRCENVAELPEYLSTLFALHQKRWESRGEPGSFSLPERMTFYRDMCSLLVSRNWLELWILELDGIPAAAQIGLRYRHSVSALQEGFDPEYSNDSVGYVLRSHIFRSCIAAGLNRYEFLAGDQESKRRWGAESGNYLDLRFAHPGAMGEAHMLASEWARGGKDWLRQCMPSRVWKMLQWAKSKLRSTSR